MQVANEKIINQLSGAATNKKERKCTLILLDVECTPLYGNHPISLTPRPCIPYVRKFLPEVSPISPMHDAIGENFFRECFCTVKFLTHLYTHTYAHSNSQVPPTTFWKVTHNWQNFCPNTKHEHWRKF